MNYPIKSPEDRNSKGGQRGNKNALKHGFYSASLKPEERQALEENLSASLQADIDLMTTSIDNFLQESADDQARTWDQMLEQLRAVTVATASKASMIRVKANMAKKIEAIADTEKWLRGLMEEE